VTLIQRHYIISFLWVLGLIGLTFFQGVDVPPDTLNEYNTIMAGINHRK